MGKTKWMIASDLHGSALFCEKMLDAYDGEQADRLLLLGDILYHGPRNDLPEGYAPKEVIAMLNERKRDLLCVRGNCDAEVDQMVLQFPILSDSLLFPWNRQILYATHGHRFSPEAPPPLHAGDVLLFGHTHIPIAEKRDEIYCINPGSVSLPKGNSTRGYLLLEDGIFLRKSFVSSFPEWSFPIY